MTAEAHVDLVLRPAGSLGALDILLKAPETVLEEGF